MGTNYYLHENACPHCGRPERELHIGKSSAGWHFSLHVIPEEGINSLEDWIERFNLPNNAISDEYGAKFGSEALLGVIRNRKWKDRDDKPPFGYDSWGYFYERNGCEPGQNGLVRSKVDGGHCIGHGEGTWDLITGDFS